VQYLDLALTGLPTVVLNLFAAPLPLLGKGAGPGIGERYTAKRERDS